MDPHISTHIVHATATIAELTLALSIGCFTKIFVAPPNVDLIARETTAKRISEHDGGIPSLFYKGGCLLDKHIGSIARNIPIITFGIELLVLVSMAFHCPYLPDVTQFWVSFVCFIFIIGYVYFNRETLKKTGEKPEIDPVE